MKLLVRDPFATAQEQYQARRPDGTVLSSSPVVDPNHNLESLMPQNKNPVFQAPDFRNLSLRPSDDIMNLQGNEGGKVELLNRIIKKYGPNYMQNPEAVKALNDFRNFINLNNGTQGKSLTDTYAQANATRTLGALFGSKNPFTSSPTEDGQTVSILGGKGIGGQGGV